MRAEDLEENKMIETIVKVEGMMCGMCESHVNEAVRKAFPEVKKAPTRKEEKKYQKQE